MGIKITTSKNISNETNMPCDCFAVEINVQTFTDMREYSCENNDSEVDLRVGHAASAASSSTARPCEWDSEDCLLLKMPSSLRRLGAVLEFYH